MVRELYTEPKEIRVSKAINGGNTHNIMFLGDKRNKFNGENIEIIKETDNSKLADAVITKTVFKKFKDFVAADLANYWDSSMTTLALLKTAMRKKYDAAFSEDSYMTLVRFETS